MTTALCTICGKPWTREHGATHVTPNRPDVNDAAHRSRPRALVSGLSGRHTCDGCGLPDLVCVEVLGAVTIKLCAVCGGYIGNMAHAHAQSLPQREAHAAGKRKP